MQAVKKLAKQGKKKKNDIISEIRTTITTKKNCTVAHNCHGKTKSHGTSNFTRNKTMISDGKTKLNSRQNTTNSRQIMSGHKFWNRRRRRTFINLYRSGFKRKSCLLSMGALNNNVLKQHFTYKHYTNTGNNINRKLYTNKRFKSYVNTKYH